MASVNMLNYNPLGMAIGVDAYVYVNKFDTNTTNPPDGIAHDDGETVFAYSGSAGIFTITFPEYKKPHQLLYGDVSILGSNPGISGKIDSYVASTGILTVRIYDEDNASGIEALIANSSDGLSVQVFCIFSKSGEGV